MSKCDSGTEESRWSSGVSRDVCHSGHSYQASRRRPYKPRADLLFQQEATQAGCSLLPQRKSRPGCEGTGLSRAPARRARQMVSGAVRKPASSRAALSESKAELRKHHEQGDKFLTNLEHLPRTSSDALSSGALYLHSLFALSG